MDDQFYVHLHSDASNNFFPANKPWEFTLMMPEPLILQGRWFIGLVEIEYSRSSDVQHPLHTAIYCDICKASTTGNSKSQLLRYIPISRRKGQRIFHSPSSIIYLEVNKHDIDRIHITIKCADIPAQALFSEEPSRLTLHFVKCPPVVL